MKLFPISFLLFFFSTSSPLMRWPWRCRRRSLLPPTCPLNQQHHYLLPKQTHTNTNAHSFVICIPTFLPETHFLPSSSSDLLCMCKTRHVHPLTTVFLSSVHRWVREETWKRLRDVWNCNKKKDWMNERDRRAMEATSRFSLAFLYVLVKGKFVEMEPLKIILSNQHHLPVEWYISVK